MIISNKAIVFSLFGNNPKYTHGAIKNAEICKSLYPTWNHIFYIGDDVSSDIIKKIKLFPNVIVIIKPQEKLLDGTFWRFEAPSLLEFDIFQIRDVDARPTIREVVGVYEWINSDKSFHVMYDHPGHNSRHIYAGMWGVKAPLLRNIKDLVSSWNKTGIYGDDEDFLDQIIYPIVKDDMMIHDGLYKRGNPLPKRDGLKFLMEPYDENNKVCNMYYREVLKKYIEEHGEHTI